MRRAFVAFLVLAVAGVAAAEDVAGIGAGLPQPTVPDPSVTTAELVEECGLKIDAMRAALKESFGELQAAREANDIQRMTTVGEALSAIKGLVTLADQAYVALQEAAARGDREAVEHEYVKVVLAATKVTELTVELKASGSPDVASEADGKPTRTVLSDEDLPSMQTQYDWCLEMGDFLQEPDVASPAI